MAEYKDKLTNNYLNKPFVVGEEVKVNESIFSVFESKSDKLVYAKILEILPDEKYKVIKTEKTYGYRKEDITKIVNKSDLHKMTLYVGANPFKNQDFW